MGFSTGGTIQIPAHQRERCSIVVVHFENDFADRRATDE